MTKVARDARRKGRQWGLAGNDLQSGLALNPCASAVGKDGWAHAFSQGWDDGREEASEVRQRESAKEEWLALPLEEQLSQLYDAMIARPRS